MEPSWVTVLLACVVGSVSQARDKALLLSVQRGRAAWAWLGGPGEGGGRWDRSLGRLVISSCQAAALPVSLGTQVGPEGSGIWVGIHGHHLHHRGPSPSWDSWAVIPERRPFKEGLPGAPARCGSQEAVVHLPPLPTQRHMVVCGAGPILPCTTEAGRSVPISESPGTVLTQRLSQGHQTQ